MWASAIKSLLAAILVAVEGVVVSCASAAHADDLRGPVDLAAQRAMHNEAVASGPCPRVEPLPRVVNAIAFYTDPPFYSRIDPVREREFYEAVAPIRNAEEAMAKALSGFVKADEAHSAGFGECAFMHLLRFVSDNAMLETTEARGTGQVRLFSVTPVFSYLVLREGNAIPKEKREFVEEWIRHLGEYIQKYQRKYSYGNNIDYWGAAGLTLAAVALQDRKMLESALDVVERGLDEVNSVGVLPREMTRGDRSLEYGLFATQALAVTLAVAQRNRLYSVRDRNNGAILRLMHVMARNVIHPETFIALSGNPASVLPEHIYTQNLAWSALADRLLPDDADIHSLYCQNRPLYSFRAGGDWDIYFGDSTRCP